MGGSHFVLLTLMSSLKCVWCALFCGWPVQSRWEDDEDIKVLIYLFSRITIYTMLIFDRLIHINNTRSRRVSWKLENSSLKLHIDYMVNWAQLGGKLGWTKWYIHITAACYFTLISFPFPSKGSGLLATATYTRLAGATCYSLLNSTLIWAGSPSAVDVAHHPQWKPRPGWGLRLHCRIPCPLACRRWMNAAQPKWTQVC